MLSAPCRESEQAEPCQQHRVGFGFRNRCCGAGAILQVIDLHAATGVAHKNRRDAAGVGGAEEAVFRSFAIVGVVGKAAQGRCENLLAIFAENGERHRSAEAAVGPDQAGARGQRAQYGGAERVSFQGRAGWSGSLWRQNTVVWPLMILEYVGWPPMPLMAYTDHGAESIVRLHYF